MEYVNSFNIKDVEYDIAFLKDSDVNKVTSLTNLPHNKRTIYATLSANTPLSIQDGMELGDELVIICESTGTFEQSFNSDDTYKYIGFDTPISCTPETMFKLYITKLDTFYVITKNNEGLMKYIVTFNVTPSDAVVKYSLDKETYNQTTTGTGTVSNVPHGSTIYYKISKDGYETITKSQVVNSNITVTESMSIAYYILVSTNSSESAKLNKYTNQAGTETEQITIPTSSTDYKVDGLRYGFKFILSYASHITKLDTTHLNTSYIMNMTNMFYNCNKLTSLDVSHFETSKVTGMSYMFLNCFTLTSLDVSHFETSKVTDMSSMFSGCRALTSLDLSNFNTSNVTGMSSMFFSCRALTSLDLSNFNTSNVTGMSSMFFGCSTLTSLDLSNFDTSNVTNMSSMFNGCAALTHIKCKQAFKNWCWTNQDTIKLPIAMRSGGSGRWEIVG